MSSRDELELAELRAAQEQLKRQVARIDLELEKLTERISAKAAAPAPAEPAPEKPVLPVFVDPPRSIPVPPPLPTAVRAPRQTAPVEHTPEPVAAMSVHAPSVSTSSVLAPAEQTPLKSPTSVQPPVPSAPEPPKESFEFRLGTVWLVRIGIVVLLTGLVFLGNFAYHNIVGRLGPGGKLGLLYLAAGGLAGLGAWLGRGRESMRNYARVLLAGGAATAYYATYAAHFVERLRVIESPLAGGLALLLMAGAVLLLADRQKSEPLALLSVVLAYYTSAINPIGSFTLFSSLLLTAMAVFFLVRHRWIRVPFASLAGTYGSYVYWRFVGEGHIDAGLAWHGVAFLAGAWAMYTVAMFVTKRDELGSGARLAFLTTNNGAFFTGAAHAFAARTPGDFWIFALSYGTVLLGLSWFARRREADDERFDGAYLAQGLAVVTLGFGARLTEQRLAMTFAVESVILMTCSRWRHALIYQIGAGICALLAMSIASFHLTGHAGGSAGTGVLVAALLIADAWLLKRDAAPARTISLRALFFTLLALGLVAIDLWQSVPPGWRGEGFAFAAIACVASIHVLGLLEVAVPGQLLLCGALAAWVWLRMHAVTLPWWEPWRTVFAMFALAVWWKRVSLLGLPKKGSAWLTERVEPDPKKTSGAALVFVFGALLVTTIELWLQAEPKFRGEVFALAVVMCVASIHVLRMPEIAVPGQLLLTGSVATWLLRRVSGDALPWWQPLALIAVTFGLAMWWKRVSLLGMPGRGLTWLHQRTERTDKSISAAAQGFALLALAVTAVELWLKISPAWRGEAFALAAVVFVASFHILRMPEIALPGQLFLAISFGACMLRRINGDEIPWWQPLPLVATLFGLAMWWKREPLPDMLSAGSAQVYRILGSALLIAWGFQTIPSPWQPLFFSGLGTLVVLAAGWRRNAEALISGLIFAIVGFAVFWLRGNGAPSGFDLTAILIFAIGWRVAGLLGAKAPDDLRHFIPGFVAASVFVWVSRWSNAGDTRPLTIAWSLLALALFFAGLGLRERTYRLGGLAVLALAVGRIFLIDVWHFETLTRIVSFLVLGAVLMLLGYLYNRFGEKLRGLL